MEGLVASSIVWLEYNAMRIRSNSDNLKEEIKLQWVGMLSGGEEISVSPPLVLTLDKTDSTDLVNPGLRYSYAGELGYERPATITYNP